MASDYGSNFGFRRSDESVRVSEGRFRTPANGAALLIGTAVAIDPANKGFLKAAAASAELVPGVAGLLVQEEIHIRSIREATYVETGDLGVARKGALSVVSTGAGTKVWFKNTAAETRLDGFSRPAVTIVDLTGVAVADTLGWDGTKFTKVTGAGAWLTVTDVNVARGYVEGVLLK